MSVQEKIDHDYVTGVICLNGIYRYYFMPPIYWVTDSDYYDPDYVDGGVSDRIFRQGVGKVNAKNAELYLLAVEEDRVDANWIRENLAKHGDSLRPIFFVDIDNLLFVSYLYDLNYEDHVGPSWQGVFDDPSKYLPDNVKKAWKLI